MNFLLNFLTILISVPSLTSIDLPVTTNVSDFTVAFKSRVEPEVRKLNEPYDGWLNNPLFSYMGNKDSNIVRFTRSNYADGIYMPNVFALPNPLMLSETFVKGSLGSVSIRGTNALAVYFGQHVFNEILRQSEHACPAEYVNMDIPQDHYYHEVTGHKVLLFERKRHDPSTGQSVNNVRKQINEATPWIDGGTVYGNSKVRRNYLVDFNSGKLRSTLNGFPMLNEMKLQMDNYPPPAMARPALKPLTSKLMTGDPGSSENPFLLTINTVWMRWHNFLVDQLSEKYPKWSGVRKFEEARRWVIASQQHVTANEWLPALLGEKLPEYQGYERNLSPQVSELFSAIGVNYLQTLTPGVIRVKQLVNCSELNVPAAEIRLCNSYFDAERYLLQKPVAFFDEMILAMANHAAEKEDHKVVEDLRTFYYGELDFTRRDLVADSIQSAREQGVPAYLDVREALNLTIYLTFEEIGQHLWPQLDQITLDRVKQVYEGNVWKIDGLLGSFFEIKSGRGQTFFRILMEQFMRIRDGDRFWYQNQQNGLFTLEDIKSIEQLTFKEILTTVTGIGRQHLQANVFRLPDNQNNQLPVRHDCMLEDRELAYRCQSMLFNDHPTTDNSSSSSTTCFAIRPLDEHTAEPCTGPKTFDYFHGSETWYVATFISVPLLIICFLPLACVLVQMRKRENSRLSKKLSNVKMNEMNKNSCLVLEWVDKDEDERLIEIEFNAIKNRISLTSFADRQPLRQIHLHHVKRVLLQCNSGHKKYFFVLKMLHEYDLVLRFDSLDEREDFCTLMERYLNSIGVGSERVETELKKMLRNAYTKRKRLADLELFFRAVFSHAFGLTADKHRISNIRRIRNILNTELTQVEFAETLTIRPDSQFVLQMFALVDKDHNGYISFREFLDMMIIFAKGSAEQKAKLMFDMYDLNASGVLTKNEFTVMIRSMLELANQNISSNELEQLVFSMFQLAGLQNRDKLNFADFIHILGDFKEEFNYLELNLEGSGIRPMPATVGKAQRQSAIVRAQETFVRAYSIFGGVENSPSIKTESNFIKLKSGSTDEQQEEEEDNRQNAVVRFLDERRWHIFWMIVFHLLLVGMFLDKAYYYTFEKEHQGMRRMGGLGITLTRGAASSMIFCFALLLMSMCRNLITSFRETWLHHFIPFDAAVTFHKYVAFWAFVLGIVHSVGHALNFYQISTQSPSTLRCLFDEVYIENDTLPKFQDWCFKTITGLTGIILLVLMCLLFTFAMPFARRHIFQAFWATHSLYPLIYLLIILHGLGKLVQPPLFLYFMAFPFTLFTLDRLISISRKKIEISAVQCLLHPSEVTYLELKRPPNFTYKSGQWARIACLKLNKDEYHPFTLASAPHEENVQFYVRAVGPFTQNLRQMVVNLSKSSHPASFYLDGPYGEGHQDWSKYEVSILVGGGIGVTPFASILKDIAFQSQQCAQHNCKRIFFLWITRTQKQFEWMVDIIRQVEQCDRQKLVSTHIFITQFQKKFDLRTMMLYVCERHFQRVSGRSLFTGLQAKTHFGRPDFEFFFTSLQKAFVNVHRMGVFSCGPVQMTSNVQRACELLNRKSGPLFVHHYENF